MVNRNSIYWKRAEQGLCTRGCGNVALPGKRQCQKCLDYVREVANPKAIHKLRVETFNHYGNHCACCGEDRWEFLTLDHIENNGAQHRLELMGASRGGGMFYSRLKKLGYPDCGLQTLCANCNLAKLRTKICPHKQPHAPPNISPR
jgi:hypothetical protein